MILLSYPEDIYYVVGIISLDHNSWPIIQALYDKNGTRRGHPCPMDTFLDYLEGLIYVAPSEKESSNMRKMHRFTLRMRIVLFGHLLFIDTF